MNYEVLVIICFCFFLFTSIKLASSILQVKMCGYLPFFYFLLCHWYSSFIWWFGWSIACPILRTLVPVFILYLFLKFSIHFVSLCCKTNAAICNKHFLFSFIHILSTRKENWFRPPNHLLFYFYFLENLYLLQLLTGKRNQAGESCYLLLFGKRNEGLRSTHVFFM